MHVPYRTIVRFTLGLLLFAAGWIVAQMTPALLAQGETSKKPAPATGFDQNVVAHVNGVPITRQELAEELLARKGKQQLELLINRKIIEQAAQKAGVIITDAEVEADLKEFIQTSGCSSAIEFEKRVLKQRQTTLFEYKEDVIKPAILMRKLGGKHVEVTEEELKKAFDAKYGERVECRIILAKDEKAARKTYTDILAAAASNGGKDALPNAFLRFAKIQADPNLAACGGTIAPISRHSGYEVLEQKVFALQDGEMTEVIQVPEGFVIVLRERLRPPEAGKRFETEREALRREAAEKKLRVEVPKLFKELRDKAVVRDYLNNKYDIKQIMEELTRVGPVR
jgi:hypothetical protein